MHSASGWRVVLHGLIFGAVMAFQGRMKSLDGLNDLDRRNYFSKPYVPPEMAHSAMEKGRAGQEGALNEAMDKVAPPACPAPLRAPLKRS